MKSQYVNELAQGGRVDTVFVLRRRELRAARSGDAYLSLELADRTGSLPGIMFKPETSARNIPVGGPVQIRGTVTSYRGCKRISVDRMLPAGEYERSDMMTTTTRDISELKDEFRTLVQGIGGHDLRRILRGIFGDKAFLQRFYECPGAQTQHHACVGGLLEHTVAVARLCTSLAETYEQVDRDLLVTAALLHDIGKVKELAFQVGIEYTDEGRLLGHVVLGERMLRDVIGRMRPSAPEGMITRLSHAMLSHHGELEWGAPKRPSTIEALLLHHADNLDAKASGFIAYTSGAMLIDERWTDVDNMFRRPLYAPRPLEDERVVRAEEDDSFCRASA